jgi:hypothetical protein
MIISANAWTFFGFPATRSEFGDPVLPFLARRILEKKIRHNVPAFSKSVGIPLCTVNNQPNPPPEKS